MPNINIPVSVSIDAKGDISCPDTLGASIGDTMTWSVAGGTITSITPGRPSPFTAVPVSVNGQWSATIAGAGSYTVMDLQGKQKPAKITLVLPETVGY
jgi:hypothetical protein